MVIQCSLLTRIHEKSTLAGALAQFIERETWNGDPQTPRTIPGHEALHGVLRACEDQTSSFNWNGLILATAAALDIVGNDAFGPIPLSVLKGALRMFPLVQNLPEDRMISINTSIPAGTCSLVVWAHHVLGLTVVVKRSSQVEKQFGDGVSHIIIALQDERLSYTGNISELEIAQPSITLLSVPEKETLITLKPEPDEVGIDAVFTQSAAGYGRKILESVCGSKEQNSLVHELTLLAIAFAAIISQLLSPKPRSSFADTSGDDLHEAENLKCTISEQDLMFAARFLFDDPKLDIKSIRCHILMFSRKALDRNLEMPATISIILGQLNLPSQKDQRATWDRMLETVRYLSVVILAFASVRDLKDCAELPLCHSLQVLSRHDLIIQMNHWDGKSRVWIPEDTWFLVLVQLLVGDKATVDPESTCLISRHGWSVYLSTFGDADPSFTDAGYVVIKRGVPCLNGVWKHAIVDGNTGGWRNEWKVVHTAGAKESLHCTNAVYKRPQFCGERYGRFLVNLRFGMEPSLVNDTDGTGWRGNFQGETEIRRSGYRELFAANWGVQRTKPCQHESLEVTLPLSCVSVSGFGDISMFETARMVIFLTAHNPSARWCALLAIRMNRSISTVDQVALRGEDCCFQCAINQTLVRTGRWFLVL